MKEVLQALRDAVDVLEKLRLPYAVMGGFAVRVWSIPRATWDVDVTVTAGPGDLTRLKEEFENRGYSMPAVYDSGWKDAVGGMPVIKFRWYVPGGDLDHGVLVGAVVEHVHLGGQEGKHTSLLPG